MPKRTITELQATAEGSSKSHAVGDGLKPELRPRGDQQENEMGDFEDAWEDEVESDEEVIDAGDGGEDPDGKGRK
jgi:ribosome assembly protein RRB1